MGVRNLIFSEGEFYHVYSRGVEKRVIFLDQGDYKRFTALLYVANNFESIHISNYQGLALMEIPRGETLVSIGAWCLMPNHFHLLLKEKTENGISSFMQKLLTGYSMYFNAKYQRKGTLFEGKFSAKHLFSDNYLKHMYAYLHLNPIGIVESDWKQKIIKNKSKTIKFLESYFYSSYFDYVGRDRIESRIIDKEHFPEYFESEVGFIDMLNDWIDFAEYPSKF